MKYLAIVLGLYLASAQAFAGGISIGSGGKATEGGISGGTPPAGGESLQGGSIGGSTGTSGAEVIELTPAEILEAMQSGLTGKPFVVKGPDGLINLKPESFDFTKKTIQFENEIGEKLIGRQLIQQ